MNLEVSPLVDADELLAESLDVPAVLAHADQRDLGLRLEAALILGAADVHATAHVNQDVPACKVVKFTGILE